MKLFDRITSYVAIICALILCFMLVSSAGTYSDSFGADAGVLYKPYLPIDYVEFEENSTSKVYTMKIDDVLKAVPGYTISGTESEIFVNLTGDDSVVYTVPIIVRYTSMNNGNYKVSFAINVSNIPNFGTSDGWEFKSYSNNVIVDQSRLNGEFMPTFTFNGMDSNARFTYSNTSTVNFYWKTGSGNSFSESESFSRSFNWTSSSIGNSPALFRYQDVYNHFSSLSTETQKYSVNSKMWINNSVVSVSGDTYISHVVINIPFVQADTVTPFNEFISLFDLGKAETIEVVRTSIVTQLTPGTSNYPDFTGFLTTAVKGFMDFGFWGISISGILMAIVGFKLVRVIINFFSGG